MAIELPIAFLRDYIQGMRHVVWFHTQRRLLPMTLAEHCYVTAVIALLMQESRGLTAAAYQLGVLRAALFHDLEEPFTGDINALAKRLDPKAKRIWRRLGEQALVGTVLAGVPEATAKRLLADWKEAHDSVIVKAADIFSMWLYASEEVDAGNRQARSVCYVAEVWLGGMEREHKWLAPWARAMRSGNEERGISHADVPAELTFALESAR